ncbi:MAG: HIRAN domain-containing protein [Spirochaetes bacterium]|nr:HIRAN domain-containing protein [Spirochaetota bacterium]
MKKKSDVKTTVVRARESFKRIIIRQDFTKRHVHVRCFVAGYHYHDGESIIDLLKEKEKMLLIREFYNPYDDNAIAVYTADYVQLGYLPKVLSPLIAPHLEKKNDVQCRLTRINRKAYHDPYVRLEIAVRFPLE